jgi:hypothetical protein
MSRLLLQRRGIIRFLAHAQRVLNDNFEGRLVGRDGPTAWPALSPSSYTLDFFLWGCMKSRVLFGGKPEAGHHFIEAKNEAVFCVRNELGHMR